MTGRDRPAPDGPPPPAGPAAAQPAAGPAPAAAAPPTVGGVLRRIGPAGPLAVLAVALPGIGGFLLLGSVTVVGPWLKGHGALGVGLYVLGFALLAGLAILPTYAQAVLGGWAFGFITGFPAALAGFLGGALLGYGVALRATGDRVVRLIAEQPKWRAVYDALLRGGFWRTLLLVTLVRVPLNSPFAITNLVMAATRVPPAAYALGTLLGMAPRTAAAVLIAANVKELTLTGGPNRWLWGASIAVTIAVVALIGHMASRALARFSAAPGEPAQGSVPP